MNYKIRLFLLFFLTISFYSCQEAEYRQMGGDIYGTYYRIIYRSEKDLNEEVVDRMNEVNSSLSMFLPNSTLSKINKNESRELDSLLEKVLVLSREIWLKTEGAFDITVGPLVNAWGFGYRNTRLPAASTIDSLRKIVGMDKLRLDGNQLLKRYENMELDGGAIAKGLGVDLVAGVFDESGIENYMIDIGGEVRVKGKSNKQRKWRIGIDRPNDDTLVNKRELQLIVELSEGALATSGNYRNFYIHEGKKYAHTIDPRTGYPVQAELLSATVYAATCMEADAYATAFMVLGVDKSKEILEANKNLQGLLIYENMGNIEVWMTSGFERFVLN